MRYTLSTVLEDNVMQVKSARIDGKNELGKSILETVTMGETAVTSFDDFLSLLICLLRGEFQHARTCMLFCCSKVRKATFHQLRLTKLPSVWELFLHSIVIVAGDQLLQHSVNQKRFEMCYLSSYILLSPSGQRLCIQDSPINKNELNALRCACSYVKKKEDWRKIG